MDTNAIYSRPDSLIEQMWPRVTFYEGVGYDVDKRLKYGDARPWDPEGLLWQLEGILGRGHELLSWVAHEASHYEDVDNTIDSLKVLFQEGTKVIEAAERSRREQ